MAKWMVAAKKADFNKIAKEYGISPVLARIMRNRDICEDEDIRKFLKGTMADLNDPFLMKGMDQASELLLAKIREEKPIRIIGDYDVDGICSTYILECGISHLSGKVDRVIPHRIRDGYGLNDSLIEDAGRDGIDTVLTCDNGIAAASSIALAKSMGMTVVVTDHHEIPFEETEEGKHFLLPPADVIVDPKQPDCGYPFKQICGAVVAYKLIQLLEEKTGSSALKESMQELLEFAALATVCDVMELKGENRILVKEGLKALRNSSNQGLRALMEVNKIEPEKCNVYHLGFVIGPCLNATGRLDTAVRALELLMSTDHAEAMCAARELKELNDARKDLTLKGVEEAERYIREHGVERDKVMIVFLPGLHESLAGIVAGRIREKYNHPVFLLTKGEEGVKGSGRSIEGFHMYESMTAVRECFTRFGGHAMAAGLSMEEERVEEFREKINAVCTLSEDDFVPRVHIDVPMPIEYAGEELARELELLEPFGVGNSRPLFAQKNLTFVSAYRMGARGNFARFQVRTAEGHRASLVYFGDL